ncbi:MAG: hypothetical protein K2X93_18765 [Candidatus Obscuribacterales bacterium]|nr:hypothetical protein [Candidatus Obscuribacterales bacterium]
MTAELVRTPIYIFTTTATLVSILEKRNRCIRLSVCYIGNCETITDRSVVSVERNSGQSVVGLLGAFLRLLLILAKLLKITFLHQQQP